MALEVCKTVAAMASFSAIVIDSLAGLAPKAQIDGNIGDSHVGLFPKIMSDTLPVLTPILDDSGCTLIVITQLREKVGVMFGNPEHAACRFIEEQHRCMIKSVNTLNKAHNIFVNMKDRMLRELGQMQQMPLFRIEDIMKHCDITHSTATKMVNVFIALKIVKQADGKQRYRIYEYAPLLECIRKI